MPAAWVVSDPVLVCKALKDARFSKEGCHAPAWFVDESGLIGSPQTSVASDIVTSEGDEHKRLRKLHMLALNPARIQSWSATIASVTDELLDNLEHQARAAAHNAPVDVVSGLSYPLPLTIICTLRACRAMRTLPCATLARRYFSAATPPCATGAGNNCTTQ
jgi:cytochrome P450